MPLSEDTPRSGPQRHRVKHRKSRNGCHTCKARRVKCDEMKPTCGACASREEPCEYPTTSAPPYPRGSRGQDRSAAVGSRTSVEASQVEQSASASLHSLEFLPGLFSAPVFDGPRENQPLNMVDLRLLSHFVTNTTKRMSLNSTKRGVWETVFPEYAIKNEFLMRLSLALAGLDYFYPDKSVNQEHTSYRTYQYTSAPFVPQVEQPSPGTDSPSPSESNINAAHLEVIFAHHQIGLRGFRQALSDLSTSNCCEIFVGAMLLVGFAFGSLRVGNMNNVLSAPSRPPEYTQQLRLRFDWIVLIRGMMSIIAKYWPELRMSPMKDLLHFAHWTEDYKMYPIEMFTNITPPGTATWSPRVTKFCLGGYKALQDLKSYKASLDSRHNTHDAPHLYDPTIPSEQAQLNHVLGEQTDTLHVLEQTFMRIIYVSQMVRRYNASFLDTQADLEDAAVMAWPELIPTGFLTSVGGFGVVSDFSYVIVAYLYLTFTLLEDYWYLKGAFEEDIMKINTIIDGSEESDLKSLMQWPLAVISG